MTSDLQTPAAPLVSIVVPAYNCESFIVLTARSIQAQTFRDWECIIVDDGSKDGTLALIRDLAAEDARFRVVTQPNEGPSSARNHGLRLIDPRSQFVVFMDSDDVWDPDALEVLKAEIEKHPEAAGAHALGRCIDKYGAPKEDPAYSGNGNGRVVCDRFGNAISLGPAEPTSFQSLWYSTPYPPGIIITRRAAYEKVGAFDPSVCPVEDWDMNIRLSRHGGFSFVEKVILSYRRHDNNLSGQSAAVNERQIRGLLYKTFFSPENDGAHRRIARQNWRATEVRHLRQNIRTIKERLKATDPRGVLAAIAAGCMHLFRYARGFPTLDRFEGLRRQFGPPRQAEPSPVVRHNPT